MIQICVAIWACLIVIAAILINEKKESKIKESEKDVSQIKPEDEAYPEPKGTCEMIMTS